MKKRILLLGRQTEQIISKKNLMRHFFSGLIHAFTQPRRAVLWVCVGVSFVLALQAKAVSDVHPQDGLIEPGFVDVQVDDWFAPHVQKFQALGVIEGDGQTGYFSPSRQANRAEIVKMFSKYDEATRADFQTQLAAIRLQILTELNRDIEVKTYSFKNQLEQKIATEAANQTSALTQLSQRADSLALSQSAVVDRVVVSEPRQTESVAVVVSTPVTQSALNVAVPSDKVSEILLVKQGIPTRCPSGWTQSSYAPKWLNGLIYYERTCVTDQVCPVRYYQGTTTELSACESEYRQADYWFLGNDDTGQNVFRRVCYRCE